MKENTYRDIRESCGEQASAVREAKKDIARGLKEQIYKHFPQFQQLGQEKKVLIDLENALERYSNRHGNRDIVSLAGPAKVGVLGSIGGGIGATIGALGALLETVRHATSPLGRSSTVERSGCVVQSIGVLTKALGFRRSRVGE